MKRHHVHMAIGLPGDGGVISGMRSSSDIVIEVDVARALAAGIPFYVSSNGVVLSPGAGVAGVIPPRFFAKVTDARSGKVLFRAPAAAAAAFTAEASARGAGKGKGKGKSKGKGRTNGGGSGLPASAADVDPQGPCGLKASQGRGPVHGCDPGDAGGGGGGDGPSHEPREPRVPREPHVPLSRPAPRSVVIDSIPGDRARGATPTHHGPGGGSRATATATRGPRGVFVASGRGGRGRGRGASLRALAAFKPGPSLESGGGAGGAGGGVAKASPADRVAGTYEDAATSTHSLPDGWILDPLQAAVDQAGCSQ